ncbi:MAG: hypothetical protein ACRC53_01240 [Plesiomonas sp.]|uniref:hypothetical protein n=1 Tax=Plesiomonas sp. TaxID=2486279 RepID=UPI003F2B178B
MTMGDKYGVIKSNRLTASVTSLDNHDSLSCHDLMPVGATAMNAVESITRELYLPALYCGGTWLMPAK